MSGPWMRRWLAACLLAQACGAAPAMAGVSFSDPIEHAVGAPARLWAAAPSVTGAERGTLAVTTPAELVLLHIDATGAVVASERAALPAGGSHRASLADLDADGTPEAFVASAGASALAVYRREGASLVRGTDIPTGEGPGTPSVADLDADGHLDLVTVVQGAEPLFGSSRVVRLTGDAMGGFGAPQPIVGAPALQSLFVAAQRLADLDGDGDLDLLVTGRVSLPSGDVFPTFWLPNDGSGAFGPPSALAAGPGVPELGEVTGDAHLDLVRPGIKTLPGSFGKPPSDPFAARVHPGDGAGGLGPPIDVGSAETFLVAVAQLDGVGPEDIVIRALSEGEAPADFFAVPGLGGGTFGASIPIPSIPVGSFAFADLNGDGATDLAVGSGEGVSVRLNQAVPAGALDFGEVPAGTGLERTLDVRNDGAAPLALGIASIGGPAAGDFTLVEDGCFGKLLLAGQSCTVRVHFRPDDIGLRTAQLQFAGAPEPHRITLSGVGLAVPGPAGGTPRCGAVPAAPEPGEGGGTVVLSAGQLRINQRIGQAAIRRLNGVEAWLRARVQGRDICGGAFGAVELGVGITTATALAALAEPSLPSPRPVPVAAARREGGGEVRLSAAQLLINQRIFQAAIRRADALEARLAGKLTGGDLAAGALTQDKLHPRLRVLSAPPAAAEPARSRTEIAPRGPGEAGEVRLGAGQLLINQRIGQAAVRRANALVARLGAGLAGGAFADGTITARNLAPGVARP